MGKRFDGKLVYSIGASRSGKSSYVLAMVKNAKRLLVWDVEGEYAAKLGKKLGIVVVEGRAALVGALKVSTGSVRIAYHPPPGKYQQEFDFFCRCAFNWIVQAPASIVCEELAQATNAGKAGGWWGTLVTRGLKYGPEIYGVVQRAQEADKSTLGNATVINICRPNTDKDAAYIADALGLDIELIPERDLEMLQRFKDRSIKRVRMHYQSDMPVLRSVRVDAYEQRTQ